MTSGPGDKVRTANAERYTGWVVLAIWGAFWLWFYFNTALISYQLDPQQDWTQLAKQLITPAILVAIAMLAVRFELVAGILLLIFGEVSTLIITYHGDNYILLLALPLPALVTGTLFVISGANWIAHRDVLQQQERERRRALSSHIPRGRFR